MPRYYFDIRDENGLAVDDDGMELSRIQAAQEEATRALADMARDAIRRTNPDDSPNRRMAIEVRDADSPVLQVKVTFEVDRPK